MKNSILLLSLLALAACDPAPPANVAELTNSASDNASNDSSSGGTGADLPANAAGPASLATARVGPLTIPYDRALLTPLATDVGVPPDWQSQARGIKFVAADRAELIGKAECMYGQSGQASRCNVVQEAGLAFAIVDRPFAQLRAAIVDPAPAPVTLAGRDGISWEIGAEGEGAEYTLLPMGERTLLIMRQYRGGSELDEDALRGLLGNLSLD